MTGVQPRYVCAATRIAKWLRISLRGRRVQADYYPDPVIEEQAQEAVEIASKLVKQLVGS